MDVVDQLLKDVREKLKYLGNTIIEIGIIDAGQEHSDKDNDGLTNAELLYIMENGSPFNADENKQRIPKRPVLQFTIDDMMNDKDSDLNYYVDKMYDGVMNKDWEKSQIDDELEKLGQKIVEHAQNLIDERDSRFKPNSPFTIKQKSKNGHLSDIPLKDTGNLMRSITYRIVHN